ncbi:MAG: hypothetical protein AAFY35_09310 [Pseudomonadota bacterium]
MLINTQSVSDAAWRLRVILGTIAVVHVVFILGLIVAAFWNPAFVGDTLGAWAGYENGERMMWQNFALVAMACVGLFMWAMMLTLAARVFGQIADGEVDEAATIARRLTLWFWAMFVLALLSPMILSVISTWHMPEGQKELSLALNSGQLSLALSALITGCMARALALGAELWRDHREVV